jgi:hypothetical protein
MTSGGKIKNSKTHCHKGHEYTEENSFIDSRNSRRCRRCHADNINRYAKRRRLVDKGFVKRCNVASKKYHDKRCKADSAYRIKVKEWNKKSKKRYVARKRAIKYNIPVTWLEKK